MNGAGKFAQKQHPGCAAVAAHCGETLGAAERGV
jgi:hypothetical protein